MISTNNFTNSSHAKLRTGTIMQEITPNVGNLSSKWASLKWDLIWTKRVCGLFHKFPHSINLFSTRFCLNSNCVYKFLVHTYLLTSNYRTVVVASIQILLVKQIRIWHIFVIVILTVINCPFLKYTIQKKPVVMRDQRAWLQTQHWIEMLALSRLNTIMPLSDLLHRVRRYYDFCLNIGCFAIEKRVKQKFSTWKLSPVITKYVRPYFQLLVDKGLI